MGRLFNQPCVYRCLCACLVKPFWRYCTAIFTGQMTRDLRWQKRLYDADIYFLCKQTYTGVPVSILPEGCWQYMEITPPCGPSLHNSGNQSLNCLCRLFFLLLSFIFRELFRVFHQKENSSHKHGLSAPQELRQVHASAGGGGHDDHG